MAAFCACCGAEITLKAEACPVCGTPRHGMSQPDLLLTMDVDTEPSQVAMGVHQSSHGSSEDDLSSQLDLP